jgi:hypothetical protein
LLAAETAVPGKDVLDTQTHVQTTLAVWESVLRDALILSVGHPELTRHPQVRAVLTAWATQRSTAQLVRALSAVRRGQSAVWENIASRTIFEQTLLQVG